MSKIKKLEDEKIEKTKCCQSTTKDGFPIYLFLKVKIHNESLLVN